MDIKAGLQGERRTETLLPMLVSPKRCKEFSYREIVGSASDGEKLARNSGHAEVGDGQVEKTDRENQTGNDLSLKKSDGHIFED